MPYPRLIHFERVYIILVRDDLQYSFTMHFLLVSILSMTKELWRKQLQTNSYIMKYIFKYFVIPNVTIKTKLGVTKQKINKSCQ